MMRAFAAGLILLLSISLFACSRVIRRTKLEDGIALTDSAPIRNSTAQLALEVGTLKKGEEVEILDRKGADWTEVRTASGVVGWTESRHVVIRASVDRAKELAVHTAWIPAQATGRVSSHAALRISPGRSSDRNVVLYLIPGTTVEVLTRERTLRMSDDVIPRQFTPQVGRSRAARRGSEPPVQYDYWYQARLPDSYLVRAGWIYAPLVDLRIPSGLVTLQGDKVIVGWFEIGELNDEEAGTMHHYLALERDRYRPAPGTDFDRLKLFIWDLDAHLYRSTWQRVYGLLPVQRLSATEREQFEVQAYNEKTGALEHVLFIVDARDATKMQLSRMKERPAPSMR